MKVWSAEDYAAREFEQPAWLVPQLIPGYGILMLYAHPKTGKSILSQQLAHELWHGGKLLGHSIPEKLKVLYVQSDLPEMEWAEQMKLLGVCQSCDVPFTKGWDTTWVEPGWLAQKPKAETEIKNTVAEGKYDLVMLDSLAKISRGIDLNDSGGVQRILAALEKLTPKPIWLSLVVPASPRRRTSWWLLLPRPNSTCSTQTNDVLKWPLLGSSPRTRVGCSLLKAFVSSST